MDKLKAYRRYIPLLSVLLLQQLVLLFLHCMQYRGMNGSFMGVGIGFLLTGIFMDFAVLYLFKWISERLEMEEKLAEFYRQRRHEREYDTLIRQHMDDMQDMCQQYEEQINNIYELMEKKTADGEQKEVARELLQKLENEIAQCKVIRYCEHDIINAVFTAKAARCTGKGITLQVTCNLNEVICADEIDLCSLIDNLMDVAIAICETLSQSESRIYVKAELRSGRFVLKQEISSAQKIRSERRGNLKKRLWCRELELIERICEKNKGYLEIKEVGNTGVIIVVI